MRFKRNVILGVEQICNQSFLGDDLDVLLKLLKIEALQM